MRRRAKTPLAEIHPAITAAQLRRFPELPILVALHADLQATERILRAVLGLDEAEVFSEAGLQAPSFLCVAEAIVHQARALRRSLHRYRSLIDVAERNSPSDLDVPF